MVFHEKFRLIGLIDKMTSNLIIKNACLYNLTSVAINSQYTSLITNDEKSQQQQKKTYQMNLNAVSFMRGRQGTDFEMKTLESFILTLNL